MEILAPVGAQQQLIAAVRSGANAVYLGTKAFNARRNADNFYGDSLKNAIEYCHARGVKVYITLNTVITDNEIDEAVKTVQSVARFGADAVIIQDMAMYRIVKSVAPNMPLHASTQMSVHNADGVRALEKLGFSRVVPARELSIEELKIIRAQTDIELEVFVHGALCMSVSGQCYLSSILGQRSANRGLCAQPCRLDFKSRCGGHALSLKDLSVIDRLCELESIGINSAKIEGRMKRPEYVAMATEACKKSLSGEQYDIDSLKAVFSRSGFTDGYISANRGRNMFGYRTKEDVVSAAPILKTIANKYRNEMPLVKVSMKAIIKSGAPISLFVTDGKNSVTVTGVSPEIAQNKATEKEDIVRLLSKCGGTPFFTDDITVDIDSGLFVAAKSINELRKTALEKLICKRVDVDIADIFDFKYEKTECVPKPVNQKIYARFETKEQICDSVDMMIIDYHILYEDRALCEKYKGKLIAQLPSLMFSKGAVVEKLSKLKNRGIDTVYAPNIYAFELAKQVGLKVMGGFGLNINNSIALNEYRKMGMSECEVSFECSLERFDRLKKPLPCGVVIYGKMPLMTFRACPIKSESGCKGCDGKGSLIDRMGNEMVVLCNQKQYARLLNPQPIYMGDKLSQLKNAHFLTLYFTDESQRECENVIDLIKQNKDYNKKFTRGLYYKEIL